jgi:hypothetical protein
MGPGEEYMLEFSNRYGRMSPEKRQKYQEKYPEAKGWKGFYNKEDECPDDDSSDEEKGDPYQDETDTASDPSNSETYVSQSDEEDQ